MTGAGRSRIGVDQADVTVIAHAVVVLVLLEMIGYERTIVRARTGIVLIRLHAWRTQTVGVRIRVTGVTGKIIILVELFLVPIQWTVVVTLTALDIGIAGRFQAARTDFRIAWRVSVQAVVAAIIQNEVSVTVYVTYVADAVFVQVFLIGIGINRAVVIAIAVEVRFIWITNTVSVIVLVARVAQPVSIRIVIIGTGNRRAQIAGIAYIVTVSIGLSTFCLLRLGQYSIAIHVATVAKSRIAAFETVGLVYTIVALVTQAVSVLIKLINLVESILIHVVEQSGYEFACIGCLFAGPISGTGSCGQGRVILAEIRVGTGDRIYDRPAVNAAVLVDVWPDNEGQEAAPGSRHTSRQAGGTGILGIGQFFAALPTLGLILFGFRNRTAVIPG
jgi:hypothetical protein